MFLKRLSVLMLCLVSMSPGRTQEGREGLDVDILFNYYDQDGDHSPVTGGLGTEALQVIGVVVNAGWTINSGWKLNAEGGLDNITSASTDAMDLGERRISGASRNDSRTFGKIGVEHSLGKHRLGLFAGFSTEYDYRSIQGGLSWSLDLNQKNTTFSAGVRQYFDTIDLYGIDGIKRGQDERNTTNLVVSAVQVLSRRLVGSLELNYTRQSGFLSTPFHEVILAPTSEFPDGQRVAERLPDLRERYSAGFKLNFAIFPRVVQRSSYRFYDDTFGITAHTIGSETHFRLPRSRELWLFPILRFHTQTASDYFGLPRTFVGEEEHFTADGDLSAIDSQKYGLGLRLLLPPNSKGLLYSLRRLEWRAIYYTRSDGLEALSGSAGIRWSF